MYRNIVYIGFGTIHCFMYPLRVLGCIPMANCIEVSFPFSHIMLSTPWAKPHVPCAEGYNELPVYPVLPACPSFLRYHPSTLITSPCVTHSQMRWPYCSLEGDGIPSLDQ